MGEVVKLGRWLVRSGFVIHGFAMGFVLIGLGAPGRALAFSEPRTYAADPIEGGGGNRWFTGSPAEGFGCSSCHSGGPPERLYIDGLPNTGYLPGATYEVRLSWPEFYARYQARKDQIMATPMPGDAPPTMGVLAELVADSGLGAGSIEIADNSDATAGERCRGGRFGAELYSVKPGQKTLKVVRRCQASALGERCILAVRACGPQELRFRWTAPATPQGAIWFATGFVGAERFSGNPLDDSVTETTRVMLPVGSKVNYVSFLRSGGCSIAGRVGSGVHAGPGPVRGTLACLLVTASALQVRRARRRTKAGNA